MAKKPEKADKLERAEIIKQLVALWDRENPHPVRTSHVPRQAAAASLARSEAKPSPTPLPPTVNPAPPPLRKPSETAAEIEERIRRRAFELSQQRRGPGSPTDDWLQAEREVLSEKRKATTASS